MTAPRSRICVMQIPRTPPTQNYSQANSADINAPARCPFFATFFGHAKKVDLKIKIMIHSIEETRTKKDRRLISSVFLISSIFSVENRPAQVRRLNQVVGTHRAVLPPRLVEPSLCPIHYLLVHRNYLFNQLFAFFGIAIIIFGQRLHLLDKPPALVDKLHKQLAVFLVAELQKLFCQREIFLPKDSRLFQSFFRVFRHNLYRPRLRLFQDEPTSLPGTKRRVIR